ncbi:hypothetical protein J4Q44_G00185530 [Coregonus suidteri]|uniref:Uncharacterized protein n=1 Tax=Coregonus suidteri TaxID=861788 RepID=A0AAN8LDQ0_9TELE
MPRVQDDKLHIVLDTLRFYQIFITCHLKAVPAMFAVNSRNRACSFIENRYEIQMGHPASYGNNQAYRSCEVSKRFEEPTEAPMTTPTTINTKRPITPKLNPASFFRVRPGQRREQLPIQKPLLWHVEKGNGHKGRMEQDNNPGAPDHCPYSGSYHLGNGLYNNTPADNDISRDCRLLRGSPSQGAARGYDCPANRTSRHL